MHIAKIYSKKHQCAFVVLGYCKNGDDVLYECQLFEIHTGITIPGTAKFEEIALGKWQHMTVVKFDLHPALIFDATTGSYGDWLMLDDNPELLEKLRIKNFKKAEKQ